jgi:hypothetical protein
MSAKLITFFALIALCQAGIFAPTAYYSPSPIIYRQFIAAEAQPRVRTEYGTKAEEKREERKPEAASAPQAEKQEEAQDESANYEFNYEVHNEETGDIKRQSEKAENGVIRGQYSLIDSDGFRRVVEYTADDKNGFVAVVKREPTNFKVPQPERRPEQPQREQPQREQQNGQQREPQRENQKPVREQNNERRSSSRN